MSELVGLLVLACRFELFADGGGRELAYVAMSRARQTSHVYVVADDHDHRP